MRKYLAKYSLSALAGDVTGGLVASLIALPYGLAMATLMGLPPSLGLVTSVLTAPVTAFLGRNPVLIGGTSNTSVPFIAAAVAQHGIGGAAKITIIAAVFLMIFCVLRLGAYISKIPHAVVSGFSCGIGVMMIISQLKPLFGLQVGVSGSMLDQLVHSIESFPTLNSHTAIVSLATIFFASLASKKFPNTPAPMAGILAALAVTYGFGWQETEVGRLSLSLPPLANFLWSPSDVLQLVPSGFGLAVVTGVNLLITSRVVEHFRGRHQHLKRADADRELGAYGIGNLIAGLFCAPLSVGIPARSLANVRCGGTTRLSNLAHAGFLVLFLTAGSDFVQHIPVASLAGITAWMGFCLLEWSTWSRLPRMRKTDAAAFLMTVGSVLVVNAAVSVALGCSVYLCKWLYTKFLLPRMETPAATALPPLSHS